MPSPTDAEVLAVLNRRERVIDAFEAFLDSLAAGDTPKVAAQTAKAILNAP